MHLERLFSFLFLFGFFTLSYGQDLYFPPTSGDEWETTTFDELGWCEENLPALCDYLEEKNSRAFIVLKDGKIVIEKYFDGYHVDSFWYWASAGKTITSMLVGIAQEEGLLDIDDKSSDYLGTGWTSLTLEQENLITVKNQLSMTTGLNDTDIDIHCTDPVCLQYKADAGMRWSYHNAPYTLLTNVVESASGISFNEFCNSRLEAQTGMSGFFFPTEEYIKVYLSKPRDFARYGLLMLNEGVWDDETVIGDSEYFNAMINSSQTLNKSYGYLWWLNGKESHMLPQSETVFEGNITPNAPADMYSGIGKNGQYVNVVPSQNLVMIRIGDSPGGIEALVPTIMNNEMWDLMNSVMCETTELPESSPSIALAIYPNPAADVIQVTTNQACNASLIDIEGRLVISSLISEGKTSIDCSDIESGVYYIVLTNESGKVVTKSVVIE